MWQPVFSTTPGICKLSPRHIVEHHRSVLLHFYTPTRLQKHHMQQITSVLLIDAEAFFPQT